MFALLKRRKYAVAPFFEGALEASRNPALYRDLGVPDTFDGRFDAMLLHLWPVFRGLEGRDRDTTRAAQDLYDLAFKRMELALRETGTGDLAVGRNVRAMMKAFYGRLVSYNACESDAQFSEALARNLYGTVPGAQVPPRMIAYARALGRMRVSLDEGAHNLTYPTP